MSHNATLSLSQRWPLNTGLTVDGCIRYSLPFQQVWFFFVDEVHHTTTVGETQKNKSNDNEWYVFLKTCCQTTKHFDNVFATGGHTVI